MDVVDVILDHKDQDPFAPFTIVMTSGDRYLIETGKNLVELRTQFFYATPGGERFMYIRKEQIAAVEVSDEATTSPRKARRRA